MKRGKRLRWKSILGTGLLWLATPSALFPLLARDQKPTPPSAASPAKPKSPGASGPTTTTRTQEESEALSKALETSPNDPQALIKNLEDFLARYPESSRREQILRTIYRMLLQSNDPRRAATAAEKLLELKPDDPELLAAVIGLLELQNDDASRHKTLQYATRFAARAEKMTTEPPPRDVSEEKWRETTSLLRATGHFLRGKAHTASGDDEKAIADFETSYAAYPTAQVAESLGDAASRRGDLDRAIDAYATAFAFPDHSLDAARRDQVRRKLGSAYVSKHHSEAGLGEVILARYDELVRSLAARLRTGQRPNADAQDPYDYVLERLDGTQVRLADYRGKIVVMDFWATWCPPCRVEGKLFERVMESFRDTSAVVFLAVNVDEDRSGVPDFIKVEEWKVPVVYGQGLDYRLGVRALPTVLIMDAEGRVVFRQVGLDPASFAPTLEKKVRELLAPTAQASTAK